MELSKEASDHYTWVNMIDNNKTLHEYSADEMLNVISQADENLCLLAYHVEYNTQHATEDDMYTLLMLVPEYWERAFLARIGAKMWRFKNA